MSRSTIEIKVPSKLYGFTDCAIDIECFEEGQRIFPCGDGDDYQLTKSDVTDIEEKTSVRQLLNYNPEHDTILTIPAYISKVTEFIEPFQEVKDFIEFAVGGSTKSLQAILTFNSMEEWSESEVDDLFSSIPSDDALNIVFSLSGETMNLPNEHDMRVDYETNNFKALGHSIAEIERLYNQAYAGLQTMQIPNIDLEFPSDIDEQIRQSAEEIYDPINGYAYIVKTTPTQDELENIIENAADISIIKKDNGDVMIGSNSSELDRRQVAYAYMKIDGDIPQSLQRELGFNVNKQAKLSEIGDEKLKEFLSKSNPEEDLDTYLEAQDQNASKKPTL